ncbi:MAG TPA: hypothetical protein PLN33_19435 [Hyphomonadaceae bacterium]|nr:hypothetical protein [Hyphomonadaceae bacterium]HPN05097.1 hypothetical protein [Hyphomonadaceae bacterium]
MWRSRRVLAGASVGGLALVLAGCGSPPSAPQGKWACLGDNGTLMVDVDYAADGSKTGTARMTQADGTLDYDAQMKFQGIWKLAGDQLTESMTVEITSAVSNGAPMTDEAQASLRNGFGAEQTSTVKVTGPDAMALINPVYGLGCTRA